MTSEVRGRILVVEDEVALAHAYARALAAAGHVVDIARDGTEGLERVLAHDYDTLLTDIRMPGISGLDLLERVQRSRPDLPVVLITAHLEPGAYDRARDAGSVRYLIKPVGLDQLVNAVQSAVLLRAAWRKSGRKRTPPA